MTCTKLPRTNQSIGLLSIYTNQSTLHRQSIRRRDRSEKFIIGSYRPIGSYVLVKLTYHVYTWLLRYQKLIIFLEKDLHDREAVCIENRCPCCITER